MILMPNNVPNVSVSPNLTRLDWDLKNRSTQPYDAYWKQKDFKLIPQEIFNEHKNIFLEIGAGSGWFFTELAKHYPDRFLIAIERCRKRGKRLVRKTSRSGQKNLLGMRGNAIPALICGIPDESLERIYILYPCPWPRTSQRKNRWYLHPVMPHLKRILKPGGLLIWASDQQFYIDEAKFVCEERYGFKTLVHGRYAPTPHNDGEIFPNGRSKFETTFLEAGHSCYELIVSKS